MQNTTSKFFLLILTLIFVTQFKSFSQTHWESLILESDTWKYLPATSEPASNWYTGSFSDAAWSSAPGGLGYGDSDDKTTISTCNSVYMRYQFTLPDASIIQDLLLDIDYDDAFVLYINGVECARSSNITGTYPAYNATLTTDHEALMYQGGSPERFQLKPSSLIRGVNVVAVQVLNYNISSSDLSARVFMHAKVNFSTVLYHPTPSWFEEPISFASSNLPIIFVNTNGQTILDGSKITADMKVINNLSGVNNVTDTVFEYDGKIGIEIRGFSSTSYPKKNYTVETRDILGENLNVKLLGMPKENDWVFHGPYSDKTLMRNVLAYNLGNRTGKWSPRTRFFEMYLNNNYIGVYVLAEKIKIDKNRCDIATLKDSDVLGDELTGGYLLKLDRPEWDDVEGKDYWISPYRARTAYQQQEYFLLVDPKDEKINDIQFNYIKNYITAFEDAMNSDNYTDRVNGYLPYIDLQSFVDYYIISELSRNLDGYRISTYLHKDKDSNGGKLTMGPFWDYNICFGNANFFSANQTSGWIIDGMGNADGYAMPFWWEKFRLDPYFNSKLKQRWTYWTENFINETYLNHVIDSCANELTDAQKRNFKTWNTLSTYVWPNAYIGGTYANEVTYLKTWLKDRITWMDSQIQPIVDITAGTDNTNFKLMDLVTYPNPFVETVNFKFHLPESSDFTISVCDVLGREVNRYNALLDAGTHVIPMTINPDGKNSQVFIYRIFTGDEIRMTGKLITIDN